MKRGRPPLIQRLHPVKRNLCRSDSIVQVRKSQKVDLDAVFSGKHHQSPNENVHTNTIKLLAQD